MYDKTFNDPALLEIPAMLPSEVVKASIPTLRTIAEKINPKGLGKVNLLLNTPKKNYKFLGEEEIDAYLDQIIKEI